MQLPGVLTSPADLVGFLLALPVPAMLALDAEGAEVRTNGAFDRLAGPGAGVRFFENGKLLSRREEPLARALAGTPVVSVRIEVGRPEGPQRPAIVSAIALRDGGGAVTGAFAVLQDGEGQVLDGRVLRDISIHTPALLFTADAGGKVDSVNARWTAIIGTGADELLGSGWSRFVYPEDLTRAVEEWARHLASGEPYVSQWRLRHGDGTYRWTEIRAEAQRDAQGNITRWFGSGTDVDAQRRALDALEFLAQSGATVAGAQDVTTVLDRLARASLEGLANISIFDLEEENGEFRRLVVASPEVPRSAVDLTAAFEAPKRGEPHPIARAMVKGETIHIPYVDEAFILRSITPPKRQEAWRFVDIRSLVCAPMITSGKALGALTLIRTGKSVPFEASDVKVIEEVARRAAVAIENVRLKEREQRAARDLQAFADMGEGLSESLGLQKTLDAAMEVVVPDRADWAYVNLLDEHRNLRLAAAYHRDEAKRGIVSAHIGEVYARGDGAEGSPAVLRTNSPVFVQEVSSDMASGIIAPKILQTLWSVGLTGIVAVPLFSGTAMRGTLHFCMEDRRHTFTSHDVEFFREFARRMAPAIANAELFERERRVARSFQDAALPSTLPQASGLVFRAIYEAGRAEALIGGDWYDAFSLVDGRIVVSIGDVAGSGLSAAVTMAGVRQAIRGAARVQADPSVMLEAADQAVLDDVNGRFVTAFVGVIDPKAHSMAYQSAGHPPPVLLTPEKTLIELDHQGIPLSLRTGRDQQVHTCDLPPGSLLTLFTDGLIESTHDVLEGERRMRAALLDPAVHDAENPAQMLHDAVLIDGSRDDVAILTIKVM